MQPALGAPDRQRIKQCLRRMFMPPVTRVQNRAIDLLRQKVDRAGMRMPHHQKIRVHRVQGQGCVNQRLTLLDRTGLHCHRHDVGPKPFTGQLETCLRPGGVFKEHVDLRQPRERIGMLDIATVQVDILIGQIKNGGNIGGREGFDPQKVGL